MHPTELFVYGTLRHDQPEHAKYCRGVTRWRRARVRGRLWMLPAGYRIATVAPAAVLGAATTDATADEVRRAALLPEAIAAAARPAVANDTGWIDGELLEFRDAAEAWPPLDRWEEFSPRRSTGCYARVVVPVEVRDGVEPGSAVAAWIYAATAIPPGAMAVEEQNAAG